MILRKSLAMLVILSLVFALAFAAVPALAEGTEETEATEEDDVIDEEDGVIDEEDGVIDEEDGVIDEEGEGEVDDEADVPATGDFATGVAASVAAVVVSAGALMFTMKKARD